MRSCWTAWPNRASGTDSPAAKHAARSAGSEMVTVSLWRYRTRRSPLPRPHPRACRLLPCRSETALVGDVLFKGSVGRSIFPAGIMPELVARSPKGCGRLGDDMRFVPGHGAMSTFGWERKTNPYRVGSRTRPGLIRRIRTDWILAAPRAFFGPKQHRQGTSRMTAINPVTDLSLAGEIAVITLNSPPVNALSAACARRACGRFPRKRSPIRLSRQSC